jgi:hypothetical protein
MQAAGHERQVNVDARGLAGGTASSGRQFAVAFFKSCRWIGALCRAHANDWFCRRSNFILTPANSW